MFRYFLNTIFNLDSETIRVCTLFCYCVSTVLFIISIKTSQGEIRHLCDALPYMTPAEVKICE